ncbi:MAG: SPOR domain-containing protein [Bacteroidetes bacterium]|nr:SPOR domain-containing protein [Bacteroidota bacterium]
MKKIALYMLLLAMIKINAQVSIKTNIPGALPPNKDFIVEITISKGSITNFCKYQLDVPAGAIVTEGESKSGNFTFENNRAKVIWVNIPSDNEFVFSLKLNTGSLSGQNTFTHKFYYIDNGTKKEVDAEPITINIDAKANIVVKTPEPDKNNVKNVSELSVKNDVVTSAQKTEPPLTKPETKQPESKNTEKSVSKEVVKKENLDTPKEKNVVKETPPVTEQSSKTLPTSVSPKSGIVYKVQLASCPTSPSLSKYNAAGKVTVSNEGGAFKVLTGNFSSKEDAVKLRNDLNAKGIQGFVVAYENGVRVK